MSEEQFDKLDAAIAGLDRDIKPERDLWRAIEAQIKPQESFWQWRVAASVFATSLLIGLLLFPEGENTPPMANATIDFSLPEQDIQTARYSGLDAEFMQVREDSLDMLADRLSELSPATQGVILGNLNIIRESIDEINRAIEAEPDNLELQQLLQIAYRQEMAIVSTVTESAMTVDELRTGI
ncbi:MAG: hypothetical protein AAFR91_00015 [Pseudomonadota bacterium]